MEQSTESKVVAKHIPGNPDLPRDDYADVLTWHYQHGDPQDGERVRVFDRKSGDFVAEGTWEHRRDQPEGSSKAVVHTDDQDSVAVPAGVRLEVVQALPRPRPALLTASELYVAAELLEELGALYAGEKLGELASAVAEKIADGLDLHPSPPHA